MDTVEQKINALRNIDGLDVDAGLRTLSNMTAAYIRILDKFVKNFQRDKDVLDNLINENKAEEFRIAVHGYKGALANLGANELSAVARTLEAAAQSGDRELINKTLPIFKQGISDLTGKIDAVLAEG